MPIAQPAPENSIEMRRTFAASPERVFEAWTRPEKMMRWFCRAAETLSANVLEADLRVGGRLWVDITSPEGKVYRLRAEYREIKPPEKLVFTWAWEHDSALGQTLVTVEFRRLGQSDFTEVLLRHEGFATAAAREDHNKGWNGCFDMLAKLLEA